MLKSSVILLLIGAMLFLVQAVVDTPIEDDDGVSDDLVPYPLLFALALRDRGLIIALAALCFTCCVSAFQRRRVYIESTGSGGFSEGGWRPCIKSLCFGETAVE